MLTSIIILTFNKLEYTQACIESIRRYTREGTYQLIVVDNMSTDGTREWLTEQTDILSVFNDINVGFPKGCNQGMELATGDSVLLLNNDVLVTEKWLPLMNDCLYSSEDVGAVGPVTNSAYGDQEIEAFYSTQEEMWAFANKYNLESPPDWERRLKLIGFCMLIKREVIEKIGLLDEMFTPGMCEDSDYSFRIVKAGYKLILCRNIFIHHFGATSFGEIPEQRQRLWSENRAKFEEKWGFHTALHTQPREDLVELISRDMRSSQFNVLDIGCACGATLLKVKYSFPEAQLFGVEKNLAAGAIAGCVGNITFGDAEEISYPSNFFDYIILGDVLQQCRDPWSLVNKLKYSLKPNGLILASIPNGSHYSVIYSLVSGSSLRAASNVVERDALHLFVLSDIAGLFQQASLKIQAMKQINSVLSNSERGFCESLVALMGLDSQDHLMAIKYLIEASPTPSMQTPVEKSLVDLLLHIIISENKDFSEIIDLVKGGLLSTDQIIDGVKELEVDKPLLLNVLVNQFYDHSLFNDIIPLLNASLEINNKHRDTLYNYAFVLHQIGADEEALKYIEFIETQDEESTLLYNSIKYSLNNS